MSGRHSDRPWWVTVAALLTAATALLVPLMVYTLPSDMAIFIIFYPLYAILSALLGWKVYPDRQDVYWTVMILAWASFGLMWLPLLSRWV